MDKSKTVTSRSTSKNEQGVASYSSVSISESKDINSKKRVLLNTKSKRTSKNVKKSQTKTVNVVHDDLNLVCVSCGKDVFMISYDKCVAHYALSPNSRVIQIVLWIVDKGCSKHMTGNMKLLRNFVKKFMGTVRFGNDNFAAITGYGVMFKEILPYVTTAHVQPLVVQDPILKPEVALKPKPKSSIPYPSRLNDQKLCEKANNQMLKFLQIFQRLHFDISFADALLHMPKFASTFTSLLSNKEKLFNLANTPLNENCSAVLLKKLPEKLGDPKKFLIPCDFPKLDECLALADLGASINLMPLFLWKQLSLPELTSTRMTLELADRSVAHPKGVAEDIFVKVGKFYFLADFIVVDYDVDPRVPLILRRPFLRTARALIDIYGEELTLRVDDEAITFKVGQTSRYSRNYKTVNQVNVIDVSCEEYAQEVFGFSDSSTSGNPTPSDPIIASSSPSFTPFEGGDFILEEIETFSRSPEELSNLDDDYYDAEGDILYLEKLLNEDPSLTLPLMKNDGLKQVDVSMTKPSIAEPLELELKDLPSHLEYSFLEGTDKLPVIISKELKEEEKAALLKVLKSHKRAIAWKISYIKGIDPSFCTHKILMEDDFKPAVQHQRRVNPKIHEVIKKEVIKLLDAGLIYPISDSPWVSLVHCVPKKGGMTVVENEDNELIPTRYFQIPIDPQHQENTTFTCPYETFAYRRMPFGLCNAPGTFQRCMMSIFHDMIEETMEVFMDDFSVFGDSFSSCLSHLDKMLKRCEDTNLVLNWEKCHFMVKEGIVLGHKISKSGIEVERAKVDVIAKLPHPTFVKGVRSFLGHVGFYRRFIQDFSKIARPMTHLLEKETLFIFLKECIEVFNILKKKLTEDLILVAPDWDLPFEIMCDASDYAVGAVLGQCKTKHFQPIHYASKTMTDAQAHYTTISIGQCQRKECHVIEETHQCPQFDPTTTNEAQMIKEMNGRD
ncbi:reverse transcriptase domain-containing protein [Tanacetum coccineum]